MTSPFKKPLTKLAIWASKHIPGLSFLSAEWERRLAAPHFLLHFGAGMTLNLVAAISNPWVLAGHPVLLVIMFWIEKDDMKKGRWTDVKTRGVGWLVAGLLGLLVFVR